MNNETTQNNKYSKNKDKVFGLKISLFLKVSEIVGF